jgi:hypothetical protein
LSNKLLTTSNSLCSISSSAYHTPLTNKNKTLHPDTKFLYLHKFFYGGVTTFTAHLFYSIGLISDDVNDSKMTPVFHPSNKSEHKLRDFGYGLSYKNISIKSLCEMRYPFLTVIKDNYFQALSKLDNEKRIGPDRRTDNIIVVIHDPRDISDRIASLIRNWKVITIRKTVQNYLRQKYDIDSLFLYHPFYPYPVMPVVTINNNREIRSVSQDIRKNNEDTMRKRNGAVSISRIGFGKNIDIILKANKILQGRSNDNNNIIKMYGCHTPMYVYLLLRGKIGNNDIVGHDKCDNSVGITSSDFRNHYCGKFERSFSTLSNILSQKKFVVDLSTIKNDGGGTQYTFLEAIHNGCALVLHRQWIENISNYYGHKYCDFREGYNCFTIENEKELAELIMNNPNATGIVQNSKELLHRHTNIDWSQLIDNAN